MKSSWIRRCNSLQATAPPRRTVNGFGCSSPSSSSQWRRGVTAAATNQPSSSFTSLNALHGAVSSSTLSLLAGSSCAVHASLRHAGGRSSAAGQQKKKKISSSRKKKTAPSSTVSERSQSPPQRRHVERSQNAENLTNSAVPPVPDTDDAHHTAEGRPHARQSLTSDERNENGTGRPTRGSVDASDQKHHEKQQEGGDGVEEEKPWQYDPTVHPDTGKTTLEMRFDRSVQRVREIFDQPLPELPTDDGSLEPDLLIGFAHYNFRLRDQYRAVVARALGLHPKDISLSVGWSGRFDVSRFSNCRKVCGVRIHTAGTAASNPSSSSSASGHHHHQTREPLSPDLQQRVEAFVRGVRSKKDANYLNVHLINASTALKEVQFVQRNQQVSAVETLLRDYLLLNRYQVVIVHNGSSSELQWISSRGARLFLARKVQPHVTSVNDICEAVAAAANSTANVTNPSATVHDSYNKKTSPERDSAVVPPPPPPEIVKPLWDLVQCAAPHATSTTATAAPSSPNPAAAPAASPPSPSRLLTAADVKGTVHAALSRACGGVSRFPAVFCNGGHVGSIPQLSYLEKNTQALDAILLRPNDISIAKTHLTKIGHLRRRRDTLAADAVHSGTGRVHQ